jgi:hypothetical protein
MDGETRPNDRAGLVVRPVLFCAPVWWTPDFWSTHAWDDIDAAGPVSDKPSAEIEAPLDATLAEVVDAAAEAWGLIPISKHPASPSRMSEEMFRLGFVREEDVGGTPLGMSNRWSWAVPIAKRDGSVQRVPWQRITLRELLVSSSLGLIDGDVTRPYIHPVRPQGGPGEIGEAVHVAAETVRAAYDALPAVVDATAHGLRVLSASAGSVNHAIGKAAQEAEPYWFFGTILYAVRRWIRHARKGIAERRSREDRTGPTISRRNPHPRGRERKD